MYPQTVRAVPLVWPMAHAVTKNALGDAMERGMATVLPAKATSWMANALRNVQRIQIHTG